MLFRSSTFKECTEDTTGRNYKVYGTKGTYAEKWANANGHEFIEISQETALLQDVPMEYTDETQVLSPDVIGFNRTYQWYGSFTADNTAGEPIEGATEKAFNPADYPAYPYYYCVVTSTDVGFDPVEIRTGVTANKVAPADYTAYDRAVSQANALNRNLYEDLTALDEALAVDVSGKNITEQAVVDAQTQTILDAVSALVYKSADYTEVEKAIASAPEDLSVYTDDSVSALQEVLNAVDYALNITEQSTVDGYAKAITQAINSLEKKPVPPITEEPIAPNPTKPSLSDETTKPIVTGESTTSADTQNPNIPNTSSTAQISYTVSFLILLSACIFITLRKKKQH